jgi:hypothetical protein
MVTHGELYELSLHGFNQLIPFKLMQRRFGQTG